MDPNQNQNQSQNLETHQTKKILYGAVGLVLVIAIVFALMYVLGGKDASPVDEPRQLTAEEALIEAMTAKGPSTLTPEEEAQLTESMTAKGGSTLSGAELAKLRASMTATKK